MIAACGESLLITNHKKTRKEEEKKHENYGKCHE